MDQQQQMQQQLIIQQQRQQEQAHHQQQFMLLQQLQKQAQQQHHHQQAAGISRFPSNTDAHLRPLSLSRTLNLQPQNPNPNHSPNPNPNLIANLQQQSPNLAQHVQQKGIRPPANQIELQMAYQDAWRVCHPDVNRPFSSLEDACERLLPYHVVADYEAEEDDRILDSDTTGQIPSRSQQWDHNIAAKVAEFTATFEKQALAFNTITQKQAQGEFRAEERLMAEQILLQDEKRLCLEAKAEMDAREKAAQFRMAAMAQAEQQARAESQARAEMMARAPIRGSAFGLQGGNGPMGVDMEQMMNWGNNGQREDREPMEDFLNDEETENGESGSQGEWRGFGEFDLNTR